MLSGSTLLRHLAQFYCAIYTSDSANALKPIFDLQKVQDRMEMATVVGEIGALATSITAKALERAEYVARDEALEKIENGLTDDQKKDYNSQYYKDHPEEKANFLAKIDRENALAKNPEVAQLIDNLSPDLTASQRQAVMEQMARGGALGPVAQANQNLIDQRNHTGPGSNFSAAAQALTGLAVGIAGGNVNQGLSSAIQPFLTQQIGQYFDHQADLARANGESTVDVEAARFLAHAATGAAVAYVSGNDATSGAVGAVMGEAMAQIVREKFYDGRSNAELTPEERDKVRAIATLASGLVGAVSGNSFENAVTAANAGFNSAMHNDGGCSNEPGAVFSCADEQKMYMERVACSSHPGQRCTINWSVFAALGPLAARAGAGVFEYCMYSGYSLCASLVSFGGAAAGVDAPIFSVPGRVVSRINLESGGWLHVLQRHFNSSVNASQFTMSQQELRVLLQSPQVVGSPITRTINSVDGIRYERVVNLGRAIGIDKFSGAATSTMTVLTDRFGNLVTATPGRIR